MNVLMFCPQYRPIVGGAERQAEKLSKTLVRLGVQVRVLTPRLNPDTPEFEESEGLEIYRFPLTDLTRRFPKIRGLGPLNLLSIRRQVHRAISTHLDWADVVHCHIASPVTAFAAQAAAKTGIPVMCKVAMTGAMTDLTVTRSVGVFGGCLVQSLIQRINRWVVTTEAGSKSIIAADVPAGRIVIIPNGVELGRNLRHVKHQPYSARHFLYLGRLSTTADRDVPTLIRAFDKLASEIPDVGLGIVGDGDLSKETLTLAKQMRNHDRIKLVGVQKPEPWLEWGHCLILPSRREGLSNALLEGMANGLACIANDIPPNREVLDDGRAGVLVPIGDVDELYRQMKRMATDEEHFNFFSTAALNRVEKKYSIESVTRKYIELYKELKESRKVPGQSK